MRRNNPSSWAEPIDFMAYKKRREDAKSAAEKLKLEKIRRFFVRLHSLPVAPDSVAAERDLIEKIVEFTKVPNWCRIADITPEEVQLLRSHSILTEEIRQKVLNYLRVRLENRGISVEEGCV